MSHSQSMIEYMKNALRHGRIVTNEEYLASLQTEEDPFEAAAKRAALVTLSEEQKTLLKAQWNAEIARMFGGEDAMRRRMHRQRARRAMRR